MINLHSIKFKMIVFIVIMLALVMLFQTLYITPMIKKNSIKASAHNLENLADQITESVDFLFQQAKTELETIADLPSLKSMKKLQIDKTISEMNKVTRFFNYFIVVDKDGNWVSYQKGFHEEGVDILNQGMRLFKEANKGQTVFLDLMTYRGNKLLSGFLTPIYSEDKEKAGFLCGVFIFSEKNTLLSQMKKTKVGKNGYAYIVASNGHLIPHFPNMSDADKAIFINDINNALAENALVGGKSIMEYKYGNKLWIAAYHPLKMNGWGIIIQQPKIDIVKKAQKEANLITKIFIISILLCFLFFAFILQYTLKPLVRLLESMKSGKIIQDRIYPKDEIGQLAQEFNKLYLNLFQAKEALQKSEERLRSIFNAANNIAFIMTDLSEENTLILDFSPGAEQIFGYMHQEVIGKPIAMLLMPENATDFSETIKSISKSKTGITGETILVRKSGERFPALFTSYPILNSESNVIAALSVSIDISNRKKAEEELALTKTHLEYLLNTTPAVIYSYKAQDNYQLTYISKNVSNQLGFTAKEILEDPKFWTNHIHPEDKLKALTEAKKVLKDRSYVFEYRFLHKDGTYHWIRDERRLIINEKKASSEVVGCFYDITEQKHLQEQLYQAQKMEAIGTLAGGIAHDFNNLLQTISGYCELLEYSYTDHELLCKDIKKIKKAAEKAASLTGKLLAFSRKQVIQPKIFDLNLVISDMEEMLRRIIGEDIELLTILDQNLHCINADQSQIEQVIMNLVVNARDAMPNGGKLTIKTDQTLSEKEYNAKIPDIKSNTFMCLSVIDSGIGIKQKDLNRIFEPFFSTKGLGKGTGLGLSMAYGIIKQHKGWIDVKSRPSKGTTFNIYLPSSLEKAEREKEEKIIMKDMQGKGEDILLVEDEAEVREFAKRILLENGYTVLDASCAKEAEDIFNQKKGNFHLILSDVVLPDKSGLTLVEQLSSYNPDLKVLLCSGYSNHKARLSQINKRGYKYIQKPYSITSILSVIKEILEPEVQIVSHAQRESLSNTVSTWNRSELSL